MTSTTQIVIKAATDTCYISKNEDGNIHIGSVTIATDEVPAFLSELTKVLSSPVLGTTPTS